MNIPYLYLGRSKPEGPRDAYVDWDALLCLSESYRLTVFLRHLPPALPNSACHEEPGKKVQERRRTEGGAWMHPSGWGEMKTTKRTNLKEKKSCK